MKLEDLRKMFEGAKAYADDIDAATKALAAAKTPKISHFTTIVGVDFACGIDSCVYAIRCVRCGLVQLNAPPSAEGAICVSCPKCDGACVMCGISHDADGIPVRIQETGTERRRVCDQCRYDYYDVLADRFVTEKMD